jgi:protocadherin Fat 1/2/3
MIQYLFDCGSGPGVVRVDKVQINDGNWHTVVVERVLKSARIVIDGTYVAEGSGPGTNDVLNLDGNDVFFGAEVETMAHGAFDDVRNGFVGCMQHIRIDRVDLPLYGGSTVAVLQAVQDIEFHCKGIYLPGTDLSLLCSPTKIRLSS